MRVGVCVMWCGVWYESIRIDSRRCLIFFVSGCRCCLVFGETQGVFSQSKDHTEGNETEGRGKRETEKPRDRETKRLRERGVGERGREREREGERLREEVCGRCMYCSADRYMVEFRRGPGGG